MISDIIAFINLLEEEFDRASILTALFTYRGDRKEGNENIKIKLHGIPDEDKIWLYEVLPFEDYIFIPFPVNPAVYVDYGKMENEKSSNIKYFRYVASPVAKYALGGEENVKVDFLVFGYRPRDLLNMRRNKSA